MKKWVCIHKDSSLFNVEAMKGLLDSEAIPCVIINKQDSSYLTFGYVELHVHEEDVVLAKKILAIE